MNTVHYKGNTFNVTRVEGLTPAAWTVRNVNHNTFLGEVDTINNGKTLKATSALNSATATIANTIIANEQEMADWAVRAMHDDVSAGWK